MAKKTNKTHKLRGSREHGRGMKKGRGAGLRGGKGQAGWKHKKLHFLLYDQDRIRGKHGFTRHAQGTEPEPSITLQHVDELAEVWAAAGQAAKQDNGFTIDLGPLGFEKLVGTGRATKPLQLTVARASAGAVRKVEAAGGRVNQTDPSPPRKPRGQPGRPAGGAPPPGGKPGKGGEGKPGKGGEAKPAKGEAKPKGEGKPKAEGKAPKPEGQKKQG